MAFLEPDRYFSRLSRVDIARDILAPGYANVLLDVDNTILTRDTHEVPRDVGLWLARARDAGIVFCLVSNNWHHGVYDLAERLDLPIVAKAVKPLPPAFVYAMHKIEANRKNTLVIGDQLVTDVFGAHMLGMRAYLLAPLVEQDLPHTLMLRNLEHAIMGERQPEGVSSGAGAGAGVGASVRNANGMADSASGLGSQAAAVVPGGEAKPAAATVDSAMPVDDVVGTGASRGKSASRPASDGDASGLICQLASKGDN